MDSEPFEMLVEQVLTLSDRTDPIVTGTIRSGTVKRGDRVVLVDGAGLIEAVVVGLEFHGGGLMLGGVAADDLRAGQRMHQAVPD